MLNERNFAEAVVGVPGEGLNVEQGRISSTLYAWAARHIL